MASGLRVVMNDLQEIVLRILEHHEDAFILQDDFDELNDIDMAQLGAQGHFSHSRLRNASILNLLALLIGLELLDRKFSWLTMTTYSLVDSSISTTTNKADDLVSVDDSNFALICNMSRASIGGIWENVSQGQHSEEQNLGPRGPR